MVFRYLKRPGNHYPEDLCDSKSFIAMNQLVNPIFTWHPIGCHDMD